MRLRFRYVWKYFVRLFLLQIGLGIVLGIMAGHYSNFDVKSGLIVFSIFCLFVLWLTTDFRLVIVLYVVVFGFCLGGVRYASVYGAETLRDAGANYGRTVHKVRVVSDGNVSGFNRVYVARSDEISGKIQLRLPKSSNLKYGDVLEGDFFLEQPPQLEDFDYEFYLNVQGIFYTSQIYGDDFEVVEHEESFAAKISRLRVYMSRRVRKIFPEPHASLVAGLVWGERANLPEDFEESLSRTGTTHIIAVSGFNVTILILGVFKLAGKIPRQFVVGLVFIVLALFLFLVGLDNLPAMRAGVMGYVVLFSKIFGRKVPFLSLISVAAIVLLLLNPLSLFTVSLQLSFAATSGIIGFADQFEQKLEFVWKAVRTDLATTVTAILATSPITVANFGVFSVVAPLANLLVLPMISFLTITSAGVLFFGSISFDVGRYLSMLMIPLMDYVIGVIQILGGFRYSSFGISEWNTYFSLVIYISFVLILVEISYRKYYESKEYFE